LRAAQYSRSRGGGASAPPPHRLNA
jgi:hypothetical protein